MKGSVIGFTKLGTVKSVVFNECTYESFFAKLRELILKDFKYNGVRYDDKNNCYVIKYENKSYKVLYGNDLLTKESSNEKVTKRLNELISLHKKLISDAKEKAVKDREEKKTLDRIKEKAEEGLLDNANDQQIYLDYLKKDYKENPFWKSFLKKLKKDTLDPIDPYGEQYSGIFKGADALCCFIVGASTFGFLAEAGASLAPYIAVGSLVGSQTLYSLVSMVLYEADITVPFGGPFALVKAILKAPYQFIKTGIQRSKAKGKIETYEHLVERQKDFESNLAKTQYDFKKVYPHLSEKEAEAVKQRYLEGEKTEEQKSEEEMRNHRVSQAIEPVMRQFEELTRKIFQIQDLGKRNIYSKKLSPIAKSYNDTAKLFYEKGVDNIYQESIAQQLSSIEKEVDEILEKEEIERQASQDFSKTQNAIDEVIQSSQKAARR